MNELTITISGPCGSGKSILAALIAKELVSSSIKIVLESEAGKDRAVPDAFDKAAYVDEIQRTVGKITIKTIQTSREIRSMYKIHINETTTLQLNWLVAKCKNLKPQVIDGQVMIPYGRNALCAWDPAESDNHAGPIIDEYLIGTERGGDGWQAVFNGIFDSFSNRYNGPTRLVAAMRCYVANNLGDMVELPAELR